MTTEQTTTTTTTTNTTTASRWNIGLLRARDANRAKIAIRQLFSLRDHVVTIDGVIGGEERRTTAWLLVNVGPRNEDGVARWQRVGDAFNWQITRENVEAVIAALDNEFHAGLKTVTLVHDQRITAEAAQDIRERNLAQTAATTARRAEESARLKALESKLPADARYAIVAEYEVDACDLMSDLFSTTIERRVLIGWSKSERFSFAELRKAAAGSSIPEIAALATADAKAEHRDNHAGGHGYYLKNAGRYDTAWSVRRHYQKIAGGVLPSRLGEYEDGLPVATAKAAPTSETIATPAGEGEFTIHEVFHTKREANVYLVVAATRTEREVYDARLAVARRLGGWYSRPWQGVPGGFMFKAPDAAQKFIAEIATVQS